MSTEDRHWTGISSRLICLKVLVTVSIKSAALGMSTVLIHSNRACFFIRKFSGHDGNQSDKQEMDSWSAEDTDWLIGDTNEGGADNYKGGKSNNRRK